MIPGCLCRYPSAGPRITYRGGYKYQLEFNYRIQLQHFTGEAFHHPKEFIVLEPSGALLVKAGYAWDGPSGPTIDTPTFMRGSLVHDALYQVLRETNRSDHDVLRRAADRELRRICLEDGMHPVRAWYVYWAVRLFGAPAARGRRDMVTAP